VEFVGIEVTLLAVVQGNIWVGCLDGGVGVGSRQFVRLWLRGRNDGGGTCGDGGNGRCADEIDELKWV